MSSSISQPNLVKNPLTSALNSKINPNPLSAPKLGSNVGFGSTQTSTPSTNNPPAYNPNPNAQPNGNAPIGTGPTGPGLKGALGGLWDTGANITGGLGNFYNNVMNGTSGGYNNSGSTQLTGSQSAQNKFLGINSPSTTSNTPTSTGTTSNNGTIQGSNGSSNTPTPIPTAQPTPTPVQNQGFGTSVGGINSGNSTTPSSQQANNISTLQAGNNVNPTTGQYVGPQPSTTPDYAAGQGYANSQSPFTQNVGTQTNYASGQGNPAVNTAQGTLQGIATSGTPAVQNAINNIQGLQMSQNEIANNPNLAAEVASGRGQVVGGEINAAQTGLSNQLAQQSQQITAGSNAGQIAQNQQNAQITAANNAATTPGIAPQLGQYGQTFYQLGQNGNGTSSGGSNIQLSGQPATDVSSFANAVANNTMDYNTAYTQLSNAYGGAVANQLIQSIQKSNPGFNPTAQSASVNQTASQGAQTGGEAYTLGVALKQVDTIQPVISNFLSTSGINSTDSPLYNQPINNYISQLGNPAATQQYNTMINDLQNFSSQIVSSGTALTPTGVTAATALQNPGNLSMGQINSYMNTLQTLGNNRLSVLQGQAAASGYSGYAGPSASASTSTPVAAPSTSPGGGITNPVAQGILGIPLGIPADISGMISGLLSLF